MDYHILETYTLKAMSRDINKEIKTILNRLDRLKEQKEILDLIIIHRNESDKGKPVHNETIIDPLK